MPLYAVTAARLTRYPLLVPWRLFGAVSPALILDKKKSPHKAGEDYLSLVNSQITRNGKKRIDMIKYSMMFPFRQSILDNDPFNMFIF